MMSLPTWLETLEYEHGARLRSEGRFESGEPGRSVTWRRTGETLELSWEMPGRFPRASVFALGQPLSLQISRARRGDEHILHMMLRQRDVRFAACARVKEVEVWLEGLPWITLDPELSLAILPHDLLAELIAHLLAEDRCQLTRWDAEATLEPEYRVIAPLVEVKEVEEGEEEEDVDETRPSLPLKARVRRSAIAATLLTFGFFLFFLLSSGGEGAIMTLVFAVLTGVVGFIVSMISTSRKAQLYRIGDEVEGTIARIEDGGEGGDQIYVSYSHGGEAFERRLSSKPGRRLDYEVGARLTLYIHPRRSKRFIAHPEGPRPASREPALPDDDIIWL